VGYAVEIVVHREVYLRVYAACDRKEELTHQRGVSPIVCPGRTVPRCEGAAVRDFALNVRDRVPVEARRFRVRQREAVALPDAPVEIDLVAGGAKVARQRSIVLDHRPDDMLISNTGIEPARNGTMGRTAVREKVGCDHAVDGI